MRDHFTVHRWERDEPRLTVLAVPARPYQPVLPVTFGGQVSPDQVAGAPVTRLAEAVAFLLDPDTTGAPMPVTPVPARWAHVTIAGLGWASEIPVDQRRAVLTELDLLANADVPPPCRAGWVRVGAPRVGSTGLSAPVTDEPRTGRRFDNTAPVLAPLADLVATAARRAGLPEVTTPASPHLGLGYGRRDTDTDAWWDPPPPREGRAAWVGEPTVRWFVDRLVLVEMTQDHTAGCYTWQPADAGRDLGSLAWADTTWRLPTPPTDDTLEPDWVTHPDTDPARHLRGLTPQQYRQGRRTLDAALDNDPDPRPPDPDQTTPPHGDHWSRGYGWPPDEQPQ